MKKHLEIQDKITQEQKIAEIAKLVSGLAHHINNPMASIQDNLGALSQYTGIIIEGAESLSKIKEMLRANDPDNDKVREILHWMGRSEIKSVHKDIQSLLAETQEGIDHINTILQRLLIVDQIVRYASFEFVDLNKLLKAVDMSARSNLPSKVSLTSVLCSYPLMIYGKTEQLRIAIENVINNALDAIEGRGEIKILTTLDSGWASLDICDSGEGIPQGALSCVFEPFFSTKDSINRIGLELTISRYIVQAHGGYMKISSTEGSGTCVSIVLPLHDEK
ncbi:MAG: HAMP domain-containing histidine kinase [Nitrospirae bacterium]|nr:HAMP domain-containing histidine kinase [Nitrospirota bacterium]